MKQSRVGLVWLTVLLCMTLSRSEKRLLDFVTSHASAHLADESLEFTLLFLCIDLHKLDRPTNKHYESDK